MTHQLVVGEENSEMNKNITLLHCFGVCVDYTSILKIETHRVNTVCHNMALEDEVYTWRSLVNGGHIFCGTYNSDFTESTSNGKITLHIPASLGQWSDTTIGINLLDKCQVCHKLHCQRMQNHKVWTCRTILNDSWEKAIFRNVIRDEADHSCALDEDQEKSVMQLPSWEAYNCFSQQWTVHHPCWDTTDDCSTCTWVVNTNGHYVKVG